MTSWTAPWLCSTGRTCRPTCRRPGSEKGGADAALGRSRGGWGSKLHLITERSGKPIVATLTAGQRHESPQAIPLLERALDRLWPDAVAGDKGYSSAEIRNWLQARDIAAVIPKRDDVDADWAQLDQLFGGMEVRA